MAGHMKGRSDETSVRSVLEMGFEYLDAMAEYLRADARRSRHIATTFEITGNHEDKDRSLRAADIAFRAAELVDAVLCAARKGAAL